MLQRIIKQRINYLNTLDPLVTHLVGYKIKQWQFHDKYFIYRYGIHLLRASYRFIHFIIGELFFFFSIIGLYVGLVFVVGQFTRANLFADKMSMIMFFELPQVDWILRLLLDIYLVREMIPIIPKGVTETEAWEISRERLMLEETLFAQLLCLYRSPHILFKMTRHKQQARELEWQPSVDFLGQ